jgi:protein involved in polysaccharide export with SLBB domain
VDHAKQAKLLRRFEKIAEEVEQAYAAEGYATAYHYRRYKQDAAGQRAEHEARAEYIKQREKEEREKAQRQQRLDAEREKAESSEETGASESPQAQDQSPA